MNVNNNNKKQLVPDFFFYDVEMFLYFSFFRVLGWFVLDVVGADTAEKKENSFVKR